LKQNWTADTIEHGVVQSYVESDTPQSSTTWIANQVFYPVSARSFAHIYQAWGIQEINGERRYARNVKFTGPKGEDIEALLVYDYGKSVCEPYCVHSLVYSVAALSLRAQKSFVL
jgi:hypothetical protein